jgi:hypothetical protein
MHEVRITIYMLFLSGMFQQAFLVRHQLAAIKFALQTVRLTEVINWFSFRYRLWFLFPDYFTINLS